MLTTNFFFLPPEDLQFMSKSIFMLLVCIAIGCSLVAVVTGAVLFWKRRQRERVFAVADGNICYMYMYFF